MDGVTICNLSLGMIGMPGIVSFEDASNNNARLCKRFYPILLDRVLRDHTWSFATAGHELQQLAETSFDPSLPCVCALPVDVIRIVSVSTNETYGDAPYRRVGKKVLVASLPATLVYIRRVADANEFDATFIEAVQYLLAAELIMASTRDARMVDFYRQGYEQRLATARAIDSQENIYAYRRQPRRSNWLAARRQGCGEPCGPLKFTEGTEGR